MRIFGILATIGLVAALALGAVASGAWFTHEDTITGNTVTTGEVILDAEVADGASAAFAVTNLAPAPDVEGSYELAGRLIVKNDGTLTLKWRAWLANLDTAESSLADQIMVRCVLNETDSGSVVGFPSGYGKYGPDDEMLFSGIPLSALAVQGNTYMTTEAAPEQVPAAFASVYSIYVRMVSSAGNEYENQTLQGALMFEATQPENPGWTES